MTTQTYIELSPRMRREMDIYEEHFKEWKKLNNMMNRIDKLVKEYMVNEGVDELRLNKFDLKMTHPSRQQLDQTLIPNIEDYKIEKRINLLSVEAKSPPQGL